MYYDMNKPVGILTGIANSKHDMLCFLCEKFQITMYNVFARI